MVGKLLMCSSLCSAKVYSDGPAFLDAGDVLTAFAVGRAVHRPLQQVPFPAVGNMGQCGLAVHHLQAQHLGGVRGAKALGPDGVYPRLLHVGQQRLLQQLHGLVDGGQLLRVPLGNLGRAVAEFDILLDVLVHASGHRLLLSKPSTSSCSWDFESNLSKSPLASPLWTMW